MRRWGIFLKQTCPSRSKSVYNKEMFCCSEAVQGSQSGTKRKKIIRHLCNNEEGNLSKKEGRSSCSVCLRCRAWQGKGGIKSVCPLSFRLVPFPFRFSRLPQICPGSERLMSRMIFIIAIPECPHAPKVTEILIIRSIWSTRKMTNNLVKLYFF